MSWPNKTKTGENGEKSNYPIPQRLGCLTARLCGWLLAPLNPLLRRMQPAPQVADMVWHTGSGAGPGSLKIVYLTDLHAGPTTSMRTLAGVIERVGQLEPDLVLLGGDYFFGDLEPSEALGARLSRLRPRYGIYGVLGNHDYGLGTDRVVRMLERAGVGVLRNRGARVETDTGSLWVGGVDDLWEGHPDPVGALSGRRAGELSILLSHNPDLALDFRPDCDLVLSGHTHGGQVRFGPFPLYTNSRYGTRFAAGWSRVGRTRLYVSRGIGTVEVAVRFGAPAEITLLRLQSALPGFPWMRYRKADPAELSVP